MSAPIIRTVGELEYVEHPVVSQEDFNYLVRNLLNDFNLERFQEDKEVDFSFTYMGKYRFRGNIYNYIDGTAAAFRMIPLNVKSLDQLGMPPILKTLSRKLSGMIIAVGPTGSGKSTTIAAMIDIINRERKCHIITIE
ncbi:twitching motility protein PilT, partial [Candidatus Magnetoovum chiemensis]